MSPWRQGLILMARFLGRGRSRSAAVLLAVAWGTLSMMLLLSFGEGLKRQMNKGRQGMSEADVVVLWPGSTTRPWQGMKPGRQVRFTSEDAAALKREISEVDHVAGERTAWSVETQWERNTISARISGVPPCFRDIRAHHPAAGGRFFNEVDEERSRRVVFLGPQVKERLFGDGEAVGQTVRIRGIPFTVIGIMVDKQQASMYGGPDADKVCIPLSTFETVFGERPYNNLLYTVHHPTRNAEVEPKVRAVLGRRQQFDPEDESAVHFWDTGKNREDMDKVMGGIQIFLGGVGAMTLLVAGVGLANMLFVLVHRRIREIGLQMALGAVRTVIHTRVVGESLVLAGLGGYLGIGISWLLIEGLHRIPVQNEAIQFLGKPTLSIPLAIVTVVVLIGVGCLAGLLPARRAAGLNPVEALRHE